MTPTPAQPKTQQQLWDDYRAGDNHAAYQLFRVDVSPSVGHYRYCLSLTGCRSEDAEEMHSRSLYKLLRRRDRYLVFTDALRAWRRFAKDQRPHLARRAERRRMSADAAAEVPPTDATEVHTQLALVREQLPFLTEQQRQAVMLHGFELRSLREAADVMKCSDKSVKTYYEQAVELLRGRLNNASAASVFAVMISASAFGRSLPSTRLATAVTQLIDTTPAGGPSLVGYAAIAFSLLFAGGIGVGAYGMLQPVPKPPIAMPVVQRVPTVEEVNRAAFEKDVLPELKRHLGKLVLGEGGRAVARLRQAFGTRVVVDVELQHGKPLTFVTRGWVLFDSHTRRTDWRVDRIGNADWRVLSPNHPIVLLDQKGIGPLADRLPLPVPGLVDADKAFALFPVDPRGENEFARTNAAVELAMTAFAGVWLRNGKDTDQIEMTLTEDTPPKLRGHSPAEWAMEGPESLWLDAAGGLHGLTHAPYRYSADGARLDFTDGREWWVRVKKK